MCECEIHLNTPFGGQFYVLRNHHRVVERWTDKQSSSSDFLGDLLSVGQLWKGYVISKATFPLVLGKPGLNKSVFYIVYYSSKHVSSNSDLIS